jgi:DNA-binding MltR family transcriptional regulator
MPKDIQFIDADNIGPSSSKSSKIAINEREDFYAALERAESLVKGESPRAKVLIYVSAIERTLRDVLRHTLVPSNQKGDALLNTIASDFDSQIELAFRSGIISHNLWRDLHIFRELRDDCHNRIENFSFEHTAIKSSIDTLERNVARTAFAGLPVLRMDAEDKFGFLARTFLVTLENLKQRQQRIAEARLEKLYRED